VERGQADIGDFFLTKRDLVAETNGRRLRYVCRRHSRC
jgi:hypothetical protein